MTRKQIKEQAARYTKFVEWSDEDNCFIGRCPEIMAGGVHGSDEARVTACSRAHVAVRMDLKPNSNQNRLPCPKLSGLAPRQVDPELTAATWLRFYSDVSIHLLDRPRDNREAESGPGILGRAHPLEQ